MDADKTRPIVDVQAPVELPGIEGVTNQGYRPDGDRNLGITATYEDGSQEIGRRAARQLLRAVRDKDPLPPQNPRKRLGVTLHHEDGSYDTGTRAVRNTARIVAGKQPKIYKRTMRPV